MSFSCEALSLKKCQISNSPMALFRFALSHHFRLPQPKVIVTASCGIEPHRLLPYGPLVERALEMVSKPPLKVIVLDRPQVRNMFS